MDTVVNITAIGTLFDRGSEAAAGAEDSTLQHLFYTASSFTLC